MEHERRQNEKGCKTDGRRGNEWPSKAKSIQVYYRRCRFFRVQAMKRSLGSQSKAYLIDIAKKGEIKLMLDDYLKILKSIHKIQTASFYNSRIRTVYLDLYIPCLTQKVT